VVAVRWSRAGRGRSHPFVNYTTATVWGEDEEERRCCFSQDDYYTTRTLTPSGGAGDAEHTRSGAPQRREQLRVSAAGAVARTGERLLVVP